MERSRLRGLRVSDSPARRPGFPLFRHWTAPVWRRVAVVVTALGALSVALPVAASNAQPSVSRPLSATHPRAPQPDLNQLISEAKKLQHQIDQLSEQYDGLRVQLASAKKAAKIAAKTAARDSAALVGGQKRVGQIAAASYEQGGYDPALQLATSSDPQSFIDRASIMNHLQTVNGQVVSSLRAAEETALRARETSQQQESRVSTLVQQIDQKRNAIQSKITKIQSSAYSQALAIASRTGSFPNIDIPGGNSLGAEALRYALSKQGDPYVWGAAGPDQFDCSGLVMWAYEQVGINLPHYTGNQYNSGEHISQNQLEPGDLVFFYPDISHVGMYIGNGMMVDAPDFGEDVKVERVYWNVYAGAVRIG